MKKFLSLVLALVMTMSLVTIGAGATEYKDFADKGEVQYEEAVAVLNKLGIITGYEDGSFKPTGALTRGAAAKIIVSMMIGPEAASALAVSAAPYKDVAVTNTFAGVISYCKTAGYINGYADGTFRPTGALTGFAFSKMLLGALGYRGDVEGFTGSGWIMNVSALGSKAGLFNDFATTFKGNDGVTREAACLLALNTLKATEVEYTANGNNLVVGDKGTITGATTNYIRNYVTSNNQNINKNIVVGDVQSATGNYFTLEFGEEHFPDLKLIATGDASDDFGRPSNEWSYKNAKIGTYALTADKAYTKGASGDTKADKVKDMGIKGYKVSAGSYTLNGKTVDFTATNDNGKLEEITGLTGNGVRVELFMDSRNADTIKAVVVVKTQIMQVNAVKSSEVTLKNVEGKYVDGAGSVNPVKSDDSVYAVLKNLKADDFVLVVPVKDGNSYNVFSAVVPQTATGKMTSIKVNASNNTVKGVTVAGTAYDMSALWTSEDGQLAYNTTLSTTTDSTVYLDAYGYVIYAEKVTSSNSAIIIDEIYSSLVDGRIVKYAKGWDTNGNELSINLGNSPIYPDGITTTTENLLQGKVYEYTTYTGSGADYALVANKANSAGIDYSVTANKGVHVFKAAAGPTDASRFVKAGASSAKANTGTDYYDSNVKFLFVNWNDGKTDVTGITVKNGVSAVGEAGVAAKNYDLSYILNRDGTKIIAVVVPNDEDAAVTANLLYFQKVDYHASNTAGKQVAFFTAYINGEKKAGLELNKDIGNADNNDKFFTYSVNEATGAYTLTSYDRSGKDTSVKRADNLVKNEVISGTYFTSAGTTVAGNTGANVLNANGAQVIDLYSDDGYTFSSLKDMYDALQAGKVTSFDVSYIYNGSDNAGSGTVSYLFITKNDYIGVTNNEASTDVVVKNADIVSDLLTAGSLVRWYREAAAAPSVVDLRTAVNNALIKAGASNISWGADGKVTFTVNSIAYTSLAAVDFTTRVYKLTVDSTVSYLAAAETTAALSGAGTGYIVSVDGAAATYAAYAAYTMTAFDTEIKTGYVKVTMATTPGAIVGLTYTVTGSGAVSHAKVGDKVDVVVTVSGTASGVTAATLTVAGTGATIATTAGNLPGTTVADIAVTNPTATTVVFTPANTAVASATSISTSTVTVGTGDVTFTFA